mmetsp:Transcript_44435/g.62353  ORF Transcript_44435/g.62353 Transcript_44435/m.62353 type:complete len:360 (-) Transcript_44435:19-1098(-)|eukprot:CAMPEP_0201488098 /NCGR_PEP_ID=MMETSP0151_2-20130828/16886_1 /ASSEMBLY_ACC=CAM_ASM_000257 /TAXON_ID=200890 /ORGANISM="Paramoeba atlantica, Strain 621/1 / CCAP 1560/9" /LENGTH=359 /DNA_ID=CAMNT_0047873319 /DNA_START=93 /DNA_END=1172 /DNA_ORIENTATION=-
MADRKYIPKNILVTGGAGFIASHVVLQLVKKYPEYQIINFDCLDYCASLQNIEEIEKYPNYKFVEGNICSSDFVRHIMVSEKIDTVLHFAAQSHVDNSFGNSFSFTKVNVLGTHTLLEAAYRCNVRRFVHVSTDEVYGENEGEHHKEEMVLEPTNPYSATKAAAEFIAKSYLRSFKVPLIITRGNNVYGPHQYPEKLIPKFICRLNRGMPLCIHGNGLNTRSFVYVEDVASAFDTIVHQGEVGEIYNIGTPKGVSNLSVAKDLLDLFGIEDEKHNDHIKFVPDRKYNDIRYAINSSKLNELGWFPQTEWKVGLQKTIDWYKTNSGNWGKTALETALRSHPNLPSRGEARREYDDLKDEK